MRPPPGLQSQPIEEEDTVPGIATRERSEADLMEDKDAATLLARTERLKDIDYPTFTVVLLLKTNSRCSKIYLYSLPIGFV
jgi:hypothetical protein